jgi:hypothetical protein
MSSSTFDDGQTLIEARESFDAQIAPLGTDEKRAIAVKEAIANLISECHHSPAQIVVSPTTKRRRRANC